VTFLFTDIEGSTQLWDEQPDAMRAALEAHDAILRTAVEQHDGYVFATGGDGFCVAFQRAGDAVRVALAVQEAVRGRDWPRAAPLKVRMGLHTGETSERDGDYFGSPVNRVARLVGVASGGQVLVSAATASLVADGLPAGARLIDVGVRRLRGLVRAEHLFQLSLPGQTDTFEGTSSFGNLPTPLTSFVGQSIELKRLSSELPRRRLITLTGVGGVGKSRLAVEAAWHAHDEFDGGTWLVELAPIDDADGVVHAVAAVLRVDPRPGVRLGDAIVQELSGRRLLLIVDNCEHVIDAVYHLIDSIVRSCPTVTVLATSREPLGVEGERLVGVRSLDPQLEAVELFCDRAEAADGDFAPSAGDAEVIARICRRLDGIPLAVELAAARVQTMSLREIEQRLDDRFRLLRASRRGSVERHQTLRATVSWSYQLLDQREQAVFERCAVFAGTFDQPAVAAVCADGTLDADDVGDVLASLVEKNMVVADRHGVATRYRLLETLRQFGEESLGDDIERCRDLHLHHYVEVATEYDRLLKGPDLAAGIAGLHLELDNLRAAAQWAVTTRNPIAVALVRATMTFAQVAMVPELRTWFDQILEALDDPPPYAYGSAAYLALSFDPDYERAAELARAGIAKATAPDDPETADCWSVLGNIAGLTGDGSGVALDAILRSVPLYIAAGIPVHAVMIHLPLVFVADATAAAEYAAQARQLATNLHSELADLWVDIGEAMARVKQGDAAQAVRTVIGALDAIVAAGAAGNTKMVTLTTLGVALADAPNAIEQPGTILAAALHSVRSDGFPMGVLNGLYATSLFLVATERLEAAAVVLSYLDTTGFAPTLGALQRQRAEAMIDADPRHHEWRERGTRLSRDEVVDIALAALGQEP
jgi:predicted ATPase/class 3 adenylate cyclase